MFEHDFAKCVVKYIFGAAGAGNIIGGEGLAQFDSSPITIGPGVPFGKINGGGWTFRGMETTMDGGGPVGITMGGGLSDLLGRLMYIGPGAGAGTTIWGGDGGSGGIFAKTVCEQSVVDGELEPDNDFSNGNIFELGRVDINVGADLDAAASNTRTALGGNLSITFDEDDTVVSRAIIVAGGRASYSCGVSDSALRMATRVGAVSVFKVDDEHNNVFNSVAIGVLE